VLLLLLLLLVLFCLFWVFCSQVQKNLLDQFPYPYTAADADFWLGYCQHEPQKYKNMAIVVQNGQEQEAIGTVFKKN
jgi:hypothetical protein